MSKFWATCFGSSEDQSSPRRRRRSGVNDSDSESSYDTDNDESDFEDGMRKFGMGERRQMGPGRYHREEDIRLEDVVSSGDFTRDGAVRGRGEISVLDVPNTRVPPAVTQFVELVLKESQKGSPNPPNADAGVAGATPRPPHRMDTVLPQVSLLREVSRRHAAAPHADAPSEMYVPPRKAEERKRVNSGGSISSSGSSDGESEGSSSTSSGIGDSFASGNDTGGSGGGRLEGGPKGVKTFQTGNGNRSKANGPQRTNSHHWSHSTLQDVVVEDVDVSPVDQYKRASRERMRRHPLSVVEGVHMPSYHRDWGARRLYESELPTSNSSPFGNNRFTRY